MAFLTEGEVVSGPGVNSQGSPVGETEGFGIAAPFLWESVLSLIAAPDSISPIDITYM